MANWPALSVGFYLTKIPSFDNIIISYGGTVEQRLNLFASPRYTFKLKTDKILTADCDKILKFFLARKGNYESFYFQSYEEAYSARPWTASEVVEAGDIRRPVTMTGRAYRCLVPGQCGSSEPTWPVTINGLVVDGTVIWQENSYTVRFANGALNIDWFFYQLYELGEVVLVDVGEQTTLEYVTLPDIPDNSDGITGFGDSITVGYYASYPGISYAHLFAAHNGTLTNNGVNSTQIFDQIAMRVYSPSVYNPVPDDYQGFFLTGFNDMRAMGNDASKIAAYKEALRAALCYTAIPDSAKILGQSGSVVYGNPANWNNTTVYDGIMGKFTTTNDETATFEVTGDTVFISVTLGNTGYGSVKVTIDGVVKGTYSLTLPYVSVMGQTYAPKILVFSGLSAGPHTIVLTAVSSPGSTYVFFDWAAGNGWVSGEVTTYPVVYVGNCLRMNAAGYAGSGPNWNHGSDAAVAAFNVAIEDLTKELEGYGFDVRYVDACAVYNLSTDVYTDDIHPNDSGHAHIAAAFIAAMEEQIVLL